MISSIRKPDTIGILSSGLCLIHCLATPFLFVLTLSSNACCESTPLWWQWLDYSFLFISFIAVFYSTKSSNSKIIKICLWISWIMLFILILNTKFIWFITSHHTRYFPAISLIGFHLYNLKYCHQNEKLCC